MSKCRERFLVSLKNDKNLNISCKELYHQLIFNLLSLASLACLRNSAALVVFGKGLVVLLLFVDVLFNPTGLLPVKQEKSLKLILTENLENANVNFVSLFVITNLYSEIY